jgi:peptidoglycan/xylan/chitin deacetylase (PgdA/CDA1 family)/SAM-dependent methyltransferase
MATGDELTSQSAAASAQDKAAVAERESRMRQQKYIAELEEAKNWLEQQLANWQQATAERDDQIRELQAWIAELEAAKIWLDEQRQIWQRQAETARPKNGLPAKPEPASGPFSGPRRMVPLSRAMGPDQGHPIDRYYIEGFLAQHATDIRGRVLEIGDNNYALRFGGDRILKTDVLHHTRDSPAAMLVAALTRAKYLPSETFDCIIFPSGLHLIYDARVALRSLWRSLKPGGALLAACPGLTALNHTESTSAWYWRFTQASVGQLLEDVAPGSGAEVNSHGNVLAACAFLYGLAVEELSPPELDFQDSNYDITLTVRAVKPAAEIWAAGSQDRTHSRPSDPARPDEAKVLVLMYHRIGEAEPDPWGITVTPEHFREHMRVLQRDFQPIRLQHLAQPPPYNLSREAQIVVTFDDGYADNLHQALPLLEHAGVPATFFICTGGIAQQAEFWWDTLERLWLWPGTLPKTLRLDIDGQPHEWSLSDWAQYQEADFVLHRNWLAWQPPPTPRQAMYLELWQLLNALPPDRCRSVVADLQAWAGPGVLAQPRHPVLGLEQLQALSRSELADFGSHSVNHPSLAPLPRSIQQAEIVGSQRWLQEALGREVRSFSYPYGRPIDYSPETTALLREAGFEYACLTRPDVVRPDSDPLQLPRFKIDNWDGQEFERQLLGWLG